MTRTALRTDQPEPCLRGWSSSDGTTGGSPPLLPDADGWDRGLQRLLSADEHPALSVLHLIAADSELVIRRAVHGFAGVQAAEYFAIENGWQEFSVQPTHRLPAGLRQVTP